MTLCAQEGEGWDHGSSNNLASLGRATAEGPCPLEGPGLLDGQIPERSVRADRNGAGDVDGQP